MDVLEHRKVKTRKPHYCHGCAREFPVKTMLTVHVAVDQGVWERTYWCPVCEAYWLEFMRHDDEATYGDLRNGDREGWEEIRAKIEGADR